MLLEERRWTDAERFLERVENGGIEEGWMGGYIQALEGMLLALKTGHPSPQPYILDVTSYNRSKLRDAKKEFNKLLKTPMNTEFDIGYFQAWLNYINYLLNKPKVR